jgi:hypothetical protein
LSKFAHSSGKVRALLLHPEVYYASPTTASEAMPETLLSPVYYIEALYLVIVEWTIASPARVKWHKLAHKLKDTH